MKIAVNKPDFFGALPAPCAGARRQYRDYKQRSAEYCTGTMGAIDFQFGDF